MSHTKLQRGQTPIGLAVGVALLTTTGNWVISHFLNSPTQLSASISALENRTGAIEEGNKFRDKNFETLVNNVEFIRRSIEEQNKKQGIVISSTTK